MEHNNINTQNLSIALDIGTTKVVAIAGYRNAYGKVEIAGIGTVVSEGVSRGVVSNIDKTVRAISESIAIAEKNTGQKFDSVHVGVAGQHIKSLHHRHVMMRDDLNSEIAEEDIIRMITEMHKIVLPPGDKILHVIPQEFIVDNESDIKDPVGMSGSRLEGNFHIITGQISASRNLSRCVERAGLEMADMTLEPIASASAVLSCEEKEAGVVLIDIGGGTTDVTIFKDGIIRHTAVIPFGGNIVTRDIREGCTVMNEQAEKLKVKFGSALAELVYDNKIIMIPGLRGREPKEISEKNLALIIQARLEEIFDYVLWEIRRSGYDGKLIAGIVLTGGGSLLKNVNLLAERHTGLVARIGKPIDHLAHGYRQELSSPKYATGIGLLIKAIENNEQQNQGIESFDELIENQEEGESDEGIPLHKRLIKSVFTYTKEFFETAPDSDF